MARYSIEETTLTGIADAIRAKTGDSDSITVENMADEIGKIEAGGGSTVLDTCTVTINSRDVDSGKPILCGYCAMTYIDGEIKITYITPSSTAITDNYVVIENVVCGSCISVNTIKDITATSASGGDSEIIATGGSTIYTTYLKVSSTPVEVSYSVHHS